MTDLIKWLRKILSGDSPPAPTLRPRDSTPVRTKRDQNTYRPSPTPTTGPRPAIQFRDSAETSRLLDYQDIKGLVDALTGASLQPQLGLYQCKRCQVFYQTQSFELILRENNGCCVSCLQAGMIKKVSDYERQRGRNAEVSVITLDNYRQYLGHVITFDGDVCKVLESRRGGDYALMFENKTWTRGFKMVVFRDDVGRVGGARFILGLNGHHLRVRGLLMNKGFGDQIVVNDRAMLLEVQ